MNRFLLPLSLITLMVMLVACGSPNTGNESGDGAQAAAAVPRSASDVQRITPAEAKSLVDSGEAVLYDARSAADYNALHASGALSFPEADAAGRFGELPADKSLIFY